MSPTQTGVLLFTNHSSSLVYLVVIAILFGIPQGILSLANQNAVYFQASSKQMGASAGLLRTFMYMGAMLASAANGLYLKSEAITTGLHYLAIFSLVICFILMVPLLDRSLNKIGQWEAWGRFSCFLWKQKNRPHASS